MCISNKPVAGFGAESKIAFGDYRLSLIYTEFNRGLQFWLTLWQLAWPKSLGTI